MDNPYQSDLQREDESNPFRSPLAEDQAGPQVHRTDERLNPWFSMWSRPRKTIRQVIETDPRRYVLLLAILGGMAGASDFDVDFDVDLASRMEKFAGRVFGGAIGGIIFLFLYGWLSKLAGRMIGGVATSEQTRAALAWSQVPSVWLLPFGFVLTALWMIGGVELAMAMGEILLQLFFVGVVLAMLVIGIWQIIITCCAMGEVHEFSSLKGFATLFLSGVLLCGIILVLAVPILLVMGLADAF